MEYFTMWHLSSCVCAGYRNSTAQALEIGLAFWTHPVDKYYFLGGHKYIFQSSLQLLAELPSDQNLPSSPTPKSHQHIFIPYSAAVCSGCIYGKTKHN